jgi:hypothetical protein
MTERLHVGHVIALYPNPIASNYDSRRLEVSIVRSQFYVTELSSQAHFAEACK